MFLLGYAASIAYVFFLIFAVGPLVKRVSNLETSRKTIHTMLFFVWVLVDIFFRNTVHQVILPVIFIVLNTLSYKFELYKSVEREDKKDLGTIHFAIAITLILGLAYLFPALYIPSGMAVFCLTFGDGSAALLGYNFKSPKVREGKSILGFAACLLFSFLSLLVFRAVWDVPVGTGALLAVGMLGAILELAGKGLDNYSVTLGTYLVSWAVIGFGSRALTAGLLTAAVVFCIVFLTGAIDYAGSLLAMAVVFSFAYFGGLTGIVYLLLAYFSIFAVSLLKRKQKVKRTGASRSFVQIFINGLFGTLFVIAYGITGYEPCLILSMVAIGGCFVDSVSSDVGAFSRGAVYDLVRWKRVEKGLSGGVSLLGTAAALLASLLIGAYVFFFTPAGVGAAALAAALCMAQTVVDSVLGSLVQAKYRCAVCGAVTDERIHCQTPAVRCAGWGWMTNNGVNLLSSLIICAVGWLLLA